MIGYLRFLVPLVVVAATFSALVLADSSANASVTATASQDAFHNPDGWPHYDDASERIYLGTSRHDIVTGGWKFDNLGIPACAVVTNARVTLTQRNWGYVTDSQFAMEDVADPENFSKYNSPADRWSDRTDATVSWTWDKGRPGDEIESPSLAALVQELINTYGDVDSLVLLERPDADTGWSEYHEWETIESGAPARLTIEFASSGAGGYGYGYGYGYGPEEKKKTLKDKIFKK